MREIEFLEDLNFLLVEPARFKILWGGRGGGKTEGIARALVILTVQRKMRVACFREFHKSIDQSVYPTIVSVIHEFGLSDQFKILDKSIICVRTGSEFIFAGLRYNIDSIKSMARIDIAWVEEARNISKTSIEKLGPTIRGRHESDPNGMGGPFGKGPEIWMSFNPELDTDEVYKRFILKKELYAPDFIKNEITGELERYAFVKKINWSDNKWFPADQRRDMLLAKKADEADWLHVWEGHTKQTLDGAIYAKEIKKVLIDGRRGKVPYDPSKPVYCFWDLGHADHTSIWFVQRVGMYYNMIHFYQCRMEKVPHYTKYMKDLGYVFGKIYLPHDGDNETLAARSVLKQVKDAFPGIPVVIVPRIAKKEMGIRAARLVFEFCNFDEDETSEGWQCLCRYQYEIDKDGQYGTNPLHNEYSDGCFTADTKILTREGSKAISALPQNGEVLTQWGWKSFVNPHLTRKNASLVEVRFINGYTVKCTPDHLFLTESGWKSAESLTKGLLIRSGLMNFNISMENYIVKTNLDILLAPKLYIEKFGKKLLEKFQKIVTFITEMKISQTINCIIWNVCQKKNIFAIQPCGNMRMEDLLGYQMTLENLLKLGTSRQKENFGIFSKQQTHGKRKKNLANNVGNYLKHFLNKSFVVPTVLNYSTLRLDQLKHLRNLLGFLIETVKNVGKVFSMSEREEEKTNNSARTNVGNLIIQSVQKLNEKQDVWCLTVPDVGHFALENGAIVKNCDAFQTFALSLKSETASTKVPTKPPTAKVINLNRNNTDWMGSL